MTQVIILVLIGAVFIGLGGFLEKIAWDKYRNIGREESIRATYKYKYFDKRYASEDVVPLNKSREFKNGLDRAKSRSDNSWVKAHPKEVDVQKLRKIQDYVFRVYKDVWYIQQKWFQENGRYFQGKNTMYDVPDYVQDGKVELSFGLTDQVDNWHDVGYLDEYAPVQLRCDVYEGPRGHGFIVTAKVRVEGTVWKNQMHHGLEERNIENYQWVKE